MKIVTNIIKPSVTLSTLTKPRKLKHKPRYCVPWHDIFSFMIDDIFRILKYLRLMVY